MRFGNRLTPFWLESCRRDFRRVNSRSRGSARCPTARPIARTPSARPSLPVTARAVVMTARPGFYGYPRSDGSVGVRNCVLVVPTVICSAVVCERIAASLPDTVVPLPHLAGCGQLGPDMTGRVLRQRGVVLEGVFEQDGAARAVHADGCCGQALRARIEAQIDRHGCQSVARPTLARLGPIGLSLTGEGRVSSRPDQEV